MTRCTRPYRRAGLRGAARALIALALAALVGCGASELPDGTGQGPRLVGSVFQTLDNPFFRECNEGIKEVVAAHGDRLVTLDSGWNSEQQSRDVAGLIERRVAALFINPVDWEKIQPSLLDAKQQSLPCVVVDTPVKDAELVLCQVASDNVEAGRMAARAISKARPQAKIVILHIPSNKACIDRVEGFRKELDQWPGMRVLTVCDGKGTTAGSGPAMTGLLREHPEANAVFAVNDPSALGAIAAIEAAGRAADFTVVSVDGSAQGIAAVKAGKLYSTSVQFPREIGRIAAQRVYEHLAGNPVEKYIKVPLELITRDNVNAFLREK